MFEFLLSAHTQLGLIHSWSMAVNECLRAVIFLVHSNHQYPNLAFSPAGGPPMIASRPHILSAERLGLCTVRSRQHGWLSCVCMSMENRCIGQRLEVAKVV